MYQTTHIHLNIPSPYIPYNSQSKVYFVAKHEVLELRDDGFSKDWTHTYLHMSSDQMKQLRDELISVVGLPEATQ